MWPGCSCEQTCFTVALLVSWDFPLLWDFKAVAIDRILYFQGRVTPAAAYSHPVKPAKMTSQQGDNIHTMRLTQHGGPPLWHSVLGRQSATAAKLDDQSRHKMLHKLSTSPMVSRARQSSSKRQAELAQPVAEEMLAELLGPAVCTSSSPLHEATSFPGTEHREPTLQDILTAVHTFMALLLLISPLKLRAWKKIYCTLGMICRT